MSFQYQNSYDMESEWYVLPLGLIPDLKVRDVDTDVGLPRYGMSNYYRARTYCTHLITSITDTNLFNKRYGYNPNCFFVYRRRLVAGEMCDNL